VPIEESVGALADLQREGKISHIGVSNVSAAELARARAMAEIVSVPERLQSADRSSDGLIDICADAGIAFIPYYPLAKGRLAGGPGSPLDRIAERHHATPRQIALAWLLHRSPVMLPIPGTPRGPGRIEAAVKLSSRWAIEEVPGIGSMTGERLQEPGEGDLPGCRMMAFGNPVER